MAMLRCRNTDGTGERELFGERVFFELEAHRVFY